jgi:hypothetical protein
MRIPANTAFLQASNKQPAAEPAVSRTEDATADA